MKIGVLGGGQLGRMLGLAGIPLGMSPRFFDSSPYAPAGAAGELVVGEFTDAEAVARFAEGLDVCTYEFENVPAATVRAVAARVPMFPPPGALEAAQDRLSEKTLFRDVGVPVHEFEAARGAGELRAALSRIGPPSVVKTRRLGYDGRGQFVVRHRDDADRAAGALGDTPLLVEKFVPFDRELSVIAVRGRDGEFRAYPLVANVHAGGILRRSTAPAPDVTAEIERRAHRHARAIMERLAYVGVLAIEFFELDGELLGNEMAPRVHNSGHWTIEGAVTSQFENHLRAVAGLPLGDTACVGASVMLNLIGAIPPSEQILAIPGAHLHLYGKSARPGRKVGHVTIVGESLDAIDPAVQRVQAVIAAGEDAVTV